jgi:hypothetical protein
VTFLVSTSLVVTAIVSAIAVWAIEGREFRWSNAAIAWMCWTLAGLLTYELVYFSPLRVLLELATPGYGPAGPTVEQMLIETILVVPTAVGGAWLYWASRLLMHRPLRHH